MKFLCFKIFAFYGQKGYSENYTMSYKLKCGSLSCFAWPSWMIDATRLEFCSGLWNASDLVLSWLYLEMISFVTVCTHDEALEISFTNYACTLLSFLHLYILLFHILLIWFYLLSIGDCSKASLFNQVVHRGQENRGFSPHNSSSRSSPSS